ncbi:MAG: amidohydrolase family protein [Gemmatimonadaceae bacterium]|nr:amidohydrolase family protein [Gemmatimonadaceae bacterium]MCW5827555.1 amidohydrolase family protein [Gemmatimonadaceae bacterium]
MRRLALLAALLLAAPLSAQLPQELIAITRANVVDGVSDTRLRNVTIVLRGGRIESIRVNGPVPAGARVLDAADRWVAPGMIDVHTHIRTVADARRALHSGVTTVRSASVPNYQDVALRDIARAGHLVLPDMVATGVFVTPQLGETILADARLGPLAGGVQTPEQLRLVVQVNAARGVDWIKTRGTERAGLPDTDPRQQTYTEAQLRVIVEEASKANLPVMAHAHGDEGAYAAVRAGVKSIEHGTYLSDSTLRLMKDRNVWLVPTLSTVVDLTTPGGDYSDPVLELRGQHMQPRLEDVIRRAHALGVRIAAGADTDYGRESTTRIAHEVMRFTALGLSPKDALATATSGAAELLGSGNRIGRIAEGYEADLIILEHDPLSDPGTLRDPLLVITNGRIALDRLRMGLGN